MIIQATRLQAWAPAGGGGWARVGRRPPPPLKIKKVSWLYWGPFATFSSYGSLFATFFSFCGPFHHVGAFLLHGGGLFWACPPPTKISAGAHDCKEGSRACSPKIVLCDCNLMSSGHVLLRFCLKNDKNNDKL